MYKLKDIIVHVWREVKFGVSNQLFLISFLFFIVFIGTFGIWFFPFYGDGERSFWDSIDKVGMLTYCAPFLSATVFDATLRAIIKVRKNKDSVEKDLYEWGALFTMILILLVVISIANAPKNIFSWWALSAGVLSVFYWFIVNASNDSYRKPPKVASPSGKKMNDSNELMNGKETT